MFSTVRVPHANRLLATLPSKNRQHFVASCTLIELNISDILSEAGGPIRHVYFPIDSYITVINSVDNRAGLEVALVGNEGMYGIALVLGVKVSPLRALVYGKGSALRIGAAQFRHEFQHNMQLQQCIKRYINM